MIVFDKLWQVMKEKGITQYALINKYDFSRETLNRLKHNKNVTTDTLAKLCEILECELGDIAEYVRHPK